MGRQVRIFFPNEFTNKCWDWLIANVIAPKLHGVEWFWFTRYHVLNGVDENDCAYRKVPRAYKRSIGSGEYTTRSLRFRFKPTDQLSFERDLGASIRRADCWYSDFRDYDPIKDLGSMRMLHLCETACLVVIDNMDESGNITKKQFRNLEHMHHRICNISHITDYRNLGIQLVNQVMKDRDNVRYDSYDRKMPKWEEE